MILKQNVALFSNETPLAHTRLLYDEVELVGRFLFNREIVKANSKC